MKARKFAWTLLALVTIFAMLLAACATETATPEMTEETKAEEPTKAVEPTKAEEAEPVEPAAM